MDILEIFESLITGFLRIIVEQTVSFIDGLLDKILNNMLWIENAMDSVMSASSIEQVRNIIYGFGVSLMILKLLKKGFMIYILWRDGDADNSPRDMLVGFGSAIFVMLAFPMLYDVAANSALRLSEQIRSGLGITFRPILASELLNLSLLQISFLLIYFIIAIVLFIQLMRRGIELLILRLGVPIACIGLIDSDSGIFKPYMQQLFKTLFTSVIQIVLFSLSFRIISVFSLSNFIYAIAVASAAFHTPSLLQSFLIYGGGGGAVNKISGAVSIAQRVKTIFK